MRPDGKSGLTEIEAWGDAQLPLEPAPPPAGNLAYNPKPDGFPKASASYSDRFGGKPASAIDGRTVFLPTPMNRWTSYESRSATDWLEIDFGRESSFAASNWRSTTTAAACSLRLRMSIQHWTGAEWRDVGNAEEVARTTARQPMERSPLRSRDVVESPHRLHASRPVAQRRFGSVDLERLMVPEKLRRKKTHFAWCHR